MPSDGEPFSQAQLAQLKLLFREEFARQFADAGLRIDGEHQDDAREDLRFLRRLRKGVDGTAAKIGWVIIAAMFGGLVWLFQLGVSTWKGLP